MTVHLKNITSERETCKLQSIPCKIHADDSANVTSYFKCSSNANDGLLTSSFRGYPLEGKVIKVPENYRGLIFKDTDKDEIESADRNLALSYTFDSLVYWNWNKIPTRNDPFISAMDWVDISAAIHDQVPEEEEEEALNGSRKEGNGND